MVGWMGVWVNRWVDEWMDGWMIVKQSNQSTNINKVRKKDGIRNKTRKKIVIKMIRNHSKTKHGIQERHITN
jgi:hypothetical protein